jgi:hypothetical protein
MVETGLQLLPQATRILQMVEEAGGTLTHFSCVTRAGGSPPRKATNPQRAGVDADTAACKPRLREIVGIYLCRRGRSTCN